MTEGKEVTAMIILEVVGSPKEHVEDTIKLIIDKVKDDKNWRLLKEKTFKADELKDMQNFWSAFAELEICFENLNKLMFFCFDYMPSSIEILEPESFKTEALDLADFLNDLLARLHKYDMVVKNLRAQLILLNKKLEENKK